MPRGRADLSPADAFRFAFDGEDIAARPGESIGAALAASGVLELRQTRSGQPRGLHCGMGACYDCLVTVDGRIGVRACLEKAAAGMRVESRAPAAAELADLAIAPDGAPARRAVDVLVVVAGPA
jgi:D-hydroxyproline dehydrogenase subunit alpha